MSHFQSPHFASTHHESPHFGGQQIVIPDTGFLPGGSSKTGVRGPGPRELQIQRQIRQDDQLILAVIAAFLESRKL